MLKNLGTNVSSLTYWGTLRGWSPQETAGAECGPEQGPHLGSELPQIVLFCTTENGAKSELLKPDAVSATVQLDSSSNSNQAHHFVFLF